MRVIQKIYISLGRFKSVKDMTTAIIEDSRQQTKKFVAYVHTFLCPFVGGGTTVIVADKRNKKWIGIDQSVQAIKVTELRLDKQRDLIKFILRYNKNSQI